MYQSKKPILLSSVTTLKKIFREFLQKNSFVHCKALKNRKVFLDKQPEAIEKRKNTKNRLQCFWVAVNILNKSLCYSHRVKNGKNEYEIFGLSEEGKKVYVHIREEKEGKDKKLFLISTYYEH